MRRVLQLDVMSSHTHSVMTARTRSSKKQIIRSLRKGQVSQGQINVSKRSQKYHQKYHWNERSVRETRLLPARQTCPIITIGCLSAALYHRAPQRDLDLDLEVRAKEDNLRCTVS
jgi:hypothetical protein